MTLEDLDEYKGLSLDGILNRLRTIAIASCLARTDT